MTDPEFDLMFSSREEERLRELHRWLTREVSTVVLGGLVIFLPIGLFLSVMIWVAIPFSSYLLSFLPLVAFYAFTWMLRLSVSNWLEDLKWKRRFDAEDARSNAG
jgi:hypothetical protein